jgi:hypothetical protein
MLCRVPAPALALLVATVQAVSVEDARGVSADDQAALVRALSEAVERRAGPVEDSLKLRLLGVPTRIRVLAVREPGKKTGEVDLPRAREKWAPVLDTLAATLFEPRPPPLVEKKAEAPPRPSLVHDPVKSTDVPSDRVSYAPWIVVGAGVVALAVGTGFGISSRGARSEALERPHSAEMNAALEDRAVGHGWAANILLGSGLVAIGTGVVLFVIDE